MNVLLESWGGPFGGVPPFDRVRVDDFKPALEAAMDEQLRDIERIASDLVRGVFQNQVACSVCGSDFQAGLEIPHPAPAGILFGRHGLWGGGHASDPINMYDEVLATPMIWRWLGNWVKCAIRSGQAGWWGRMTWPWP